MYMEVDDETSQHDINITGTIDTLSCDVLETAKAISANNKINMMDLVSTAKIGIWSWQQEGFT